MADAPTARSLAPDLPFKFVGGDPAVDLVNTVDWTRRGPADDRLTDYERLTRWAEGAELLAPRLGLRLREQAEERPDEAEAAHRDAVDLRWALRQLFAAIAHGEPPAAAPLEELNQAVAESMAQLRLVRGRPGPATGLLWGWRDAPDRLDSILWPVARSAAELLVSDEAGRIRECGGLDCGWLYVDRSRNGLRRWCQMEVCGTREKSRRRAEKRDAAT
jgi:predicted RNA-binding Zn ribbon-like protein